MKPNIDLNNEFFQIKEVQEQIKSKNLTYTNTIFGDRYNNIICIVTNN